MKQALPLYHSSNSNSIKQLNLNEAAERLESLRKQHTRLSEKLRELLGDAAVQNSAQIKWRDFKNQVAKLRVDMESLKQII